MMNPYETLLVTILAILYVDDGMPGVNDADCDEPMLIEDLVKEAEASTQSWERLLFVSGGALELSKCFAYVLDYDLTSGHPRLRTREELDGCDTSVSPAV